MLGRMGRVTERRRLRDDALAIWRAGVEAVHAGALVADALSVIGAGDVFGLAVSVPGADGTRREVVLNTTLTKTQRVAVVGAGKATTAMADVAERKLSRWARDGGRLDGWVNVPDATVEELKWIHVHGARKLPDNRPTAEGVEGSKRILEIAGSLSEDDLLIVLLSGGGSALLPLPVEGVSLEDKLRVTALLQGSGATIGEMNCVRKHLSQIKGGRLAQATKARVVTLIVSDVIDDPLDVIASGPTAPDPTTFTQALLVICRHGLRAQAPRSVLEHLRAGAAGAFEDTPKEESPRVTNVIVGNNATARAAAVARAQLLGYDARDVGIVFGDTQDMGYVTAKEILATHGKLTRPTCFIDGGETTVTLPPDHGKGGRNQEYALAVLNTLGPAGLEGVALLCGGTDGEDGPTDAAGAFVDEALARDAQAKGLDPADFLRRHDAYRFFEPLGGLVKTGPTNTNVMDLRVVLIDRTEGAHVGAATTPERRTLSARAKP
jgi:glycerate 2-kinase